jgi:predicted small integral membrane protein
MTETRIVKIVMLGSLALLAGLVTFDNLIDFENEFGEQGLVDIASDANRMHMRRTVERLIVSEQSAVAAK